MPVQEDIVKINRKKRQKYDATQKALKILKWFSITALVFVVAFVGVLSGVHYFQTQSEIKSLTKGGYYNQIDIGNNQSINAILHGNADSVYTIVPIHDIGEEDFNIAMKNMLEPLEHTLQYTLINRPGHGFSEDTKKARTSLEIVNEYRQALKKMNVENKIILVASGFGGTYATFWANEHPDEIAGIIYIGFEDYVEGFNQTEASTSSKFDILSCKIGLKRFSNFDHIRTKCNLSDNADSDVLKSMYVHSCYTNARNAEIEYAKNNFENAFKGNSSVPKVLVASQGGFDTRDEITKFIKFKNKQNESLGLEIVADLSSTASEKKIEEISSLSTKTFTSNRVNFANKVENCKIAKIPGEIKVYRYNPYAVQDLIKDFSLYINGNITNLKEKYTDTHAEGWEQQQNK